MGKISLLLPIVFFVVGQIFIMSRSISAVFEERQSFGGAGYGDGRPFCGERRNLHNYLACEKSYKTNKRVSLDSNLRYKKKYGVSHRREKSQVAPRESVQLKRSSVP